MESVSTLHRFNSAPWCDLQITQNNSLCFSEADIPDTTIQQQTPAIIFCLNRKNDKNV